MRVSVARLTAAAAKLKEIRILLDPTCDASIGAREYVEKFYPTLKNNNPDLSLWVKERVGVMPEMWAYNDQGKEVSISITNQSAPNIQEHLDKVNK